LEALIALNKLIPKYLSRTTQPTIMTTTRETQQTRNNKISGTTRPATQATLSHVPKGPFAYPLEQVHLFGPLQVPLPLQTFELEATIPPQEMLAQVDPEYPLLHWQLFGPLQVPLPLHTFGLVASVPLHVLVVQYVLPYPALQLQVS